MSDLSALLGGIVWLALLAGVGTSALALSIVALYVSLATLVLVPLGLGLVAPPRDAIGGFLYRSAVVGQFPAAVAAVAALAAPQGSAGAVLLCVPWLGVTGAIALTGLRRLLSRGGGPLPELAIDAALVYVPVAAVFLLLHAAGIRLRFAPIIVLLTAVHFHYAGFVLPLVVGLVGRTVATGGGRFAPTIAGRAAAATTVAIVLGVALIAAGIAFSPAIEVVAVGLFAAAVVGFATIALRSAVPALPRLPGALLAVASLSLFWTMSLALAFAYSALPGTASIVALPAMIRWHGSVNAFGFALPALLAFRLLDRRTASSIETIDRDPRS